MSADGAGCTAAAYSCEKGRKGMTFLDKELLEWYIRLIKAGNPGMEAEKDEKAQALIFFDRIPWVRKENQS